MAGGTIGDVHYAHQSAIKFQEYAVKGAAVALDSYIAKDKNFKLTDWPQRAQDAYKIIDNKVYGLSVRGQVAWLFLYWNKDLLQKNSIPEPTPNWTLDEMLTHARRLQQARQHGLLPRGLLLGQLRERQWPTCAASGGSSSRRRPARARPAPWICPVPAGHQVVLRQHQGRPVRPRGRGGRRVRPGQDGLLLGRLAGERGTVANAAQSSFKWTFDIVPKGPTGKRGGFLSIEYPPDEQHQQEQGRGLGAAEVAHQQGQRGQPGAPAGRFPDPWLPQGRLLR